jgi:hypothetical protein
MTEKRILTFETIAIKDNIGYASDYNRNGLFKVELDTGKCEYIKVFENEPMNRHRIHCAVVWCDDKAYYIPSSGNGIDIFSAQDNMVEMIAVPIPEYKKYSFYNPQYKFIGAVRRGDVLWLIPSTYPGIIRFDMKTKDMKIIDDWLEDDEYMFRGGYAVENNQIIMANGKSNAVLVFDMEKEKGNIIHIGIMNNGVMSICKTKEGIWFAPRLQGAIVLWKEEANETIEFNEFPQGFIAKDVVFSKVYGYEEDVEFVPARANCALRYSNGKFITVEYDRWKKHRNSVVEYLFETEAYMFFREVSESKTCRYIKLDKITNLISDCEFVYYEDGKREKDIVRICSKKNEEIRENNSMGLREFIKGIL